MRFFTVAGSGTNFEGGRYAAKDNVIGTAARKAGARLYRNLSDSQIKAREKNGNADIKFILRETTRGSKKNTYHFIVKRQVLSKPVLIKKKGQSGGDAVKQNAALKAELEGKMKGLPKSQVEGYEKLVKEIVGLKDSEVGYIIYNKYVVKSNSKSAEAVKAKAAAKPKDTKTKAKAKPKGKTKANGKKKEESKEAPSKKEAVKAKPAPAKKDVKKANAKGPTKK
jgi:hypothetical protein